MNPEGARRGVLQMSDSPGPNTYLYERSRSHPRPQNWGLSQTPSSSRLACGFEARMQCSNPGSAMNLLYDPGACLLTLLCLSVPT